jgi:hypothetical protein
VRGKIAIVENRKIAKLQFAQDRNCKIAKLRLAAESAVHRVPAGRLVRADAVFLAGVFALPAIASGFPHGGDQSCDFGSANVARGVAAVASAHNALDDGVLDRYVARLRLGLRPPR